MSPSRFAEKSYWPPKHSQSTALCQECLQVQFILVQPPSFTHMLLRHSSIQLEYLSVMTSFVLLPINNLSFLFVGGLPKPEDLFNHSDASETNFKGV